MSTITEPIAAGTTSGQDVVLSVGGKEVRLPVLVGTEDEHGIDISNFRAKTGYITLDPGFGNTGGVRARSRSSTARREFSLIAVIRSINLPRRARSSRSLGC